LKLPELLQHQRLRVIVLGCAAAACRDVLGAPDYHLENASNAPHTASELGALFSDKVAACSQCLTDTCTAELETCALGSGCYEYSECNLDSPSPASELECSKRTHPTEQVRDQFQAVRSCLRNCITQCAAGTDFRCANQYALPAATATPSIKLEQTLSFVFGGAVAGAKVTVCSPDIDCQQAIEATTDDTGFYGVEIPVPQSSPVLAGFRGYRLVTAVGMVPHRIQWNVPMWTDWKERTELLPQWVSDFLVSGFDIQPEQGLVTAQVFDCRTAGAGGVSLELPESPDAVVHYKDSLSDIALREDTLAVSEGAALISGLSAGRFHRVIARRDGQVVGGGDVWVLAGGVSMLAIFPAARKN
jgi:hypothetical protein